jgi:AcrR family transcriptional regulator
VTELADPPRPSYRERQRAELRDTIQRTALQLFADQGYDAVTTEAIANEVGISLSTFFRHVTTKEDLLTGALQRGRQEIVTNFATRPPDEPVATGLAQAILQRTQQFADEKGLMRLWRRAMVSAPESVQRASFISREERQELVAMVAGRLGADPATDLQPGVLVQVMLAAAEHAYERWLDGTSPGPLHDVTAEALTCAGALVEPPTRTRRRKP